MISPTDAVARLPAKIVTAAKRGARAGGRGSRLARFPVSNSRRVPPQIDTVRPVGIHPNIIEADHIDIGVRARVLVEPGYDAPALLTHITDRIRGEAAGLRLGSNVLSSQVMRAFTDESGVIDVQALHLRRAPAAFGRVTLGGVAYQTAVIEAAIGDNLVMGPTTRGLPG